MSEHVSVAGEPGWLEVANIVLIRRSRGNTGITLQSTPQEKMVAPGDGAVRGSHAFLPFCPSSGSAAAHSQANRGGEAGEAGAHSISRPPVHPSLPSIRQSADHPADFRDMKCGPCQGKRKLSELVAVEFKMGWRAGVCDTIALRRGSKTTSAARLLELLCQHAGGPKENGAGWGVEAGMGGACRH